MISQTELEKVVFVGGSQYICQDEVEDGEAQDVHATSRNLGMFWIPMLGALLKSPSLTKIDCEFNNKAQPRRQAEVTEACNPACTRQIPISLCGWRYL